MIYQVLPNVYFSLTPFDILIWCLIVGVVAVVSYDDNPTNRELSLQITSSKQDLLGYLVKIYEKIKK